jgi:hypothetical protein
MCCRQIDPSGAVAGVCNIQKGDQIVEVPFLIHTSSIFFYCLISKKLRFLTASGVAESLKSIEASSMHSLAY